MKSIGSLMFLLGAAAIILDFVGAVPVILSWIYEWGDTSAWVIKIGLVVFGAALYLIGARKKASEMSEE